MTLSSTTSRVSYPGTGSTGPFAFPYKVFAAADLVVTKQSSTGAETTLAYITDYTVAGVGDATGTVTLIASLAVGETLVIRRVPTLTQGTSLRNQGTYFPADIENALDRLVMIDQSHKDLIDRCLHLSETLDPAAYNLTLPAPEAGKVMTGTGTGFSMTSLVSSADVALPGDQRTVANLTAYLSNNALWNVKDYGAAPGLSTDQSTYIQKAIDRANAAGGGLVIGPPGDYKCNVILKDGVHLLGNLGRGYPAGGIKLTQFTAYATGAVIDTPGPRTTSCGVHGINVVGLGSGTAAKGIRFRNVSSGVVNDVAFNNFADEGLLVEAPSIACTFRQLQAINCVLNRARAAKIGAVDVAGTDHYLSEIEATISGSLEGTVQSVNLYCVGFAVRMTNGMLNACIGEISDVGFYVSGSLNRFATCRGDLNYGHGYEVTGSGNQFAACLALNNSQDTTNTYDGFRVTGVNNSFVAPFIQSNVAKVHKYGINDLSAVGDANKNYYVSPTVLGSGTAAFNPVNSAATWNFTRGTPKTLTANSATPDVTGYEFFKQTNTAPTTITDFTGGVNGQFIDYLCLDANTTIQHNGATLITWNQGNVKLRSGNIYRFYKNGAWTLFGEDPSQMNEVSADNGDASKTLNWRQAERTQIWNTPLTANRAATLAGGGAKSGARWRIERRAGATGAFTLDVGGGPLRSLLVNQWCEVEYDGAAWFLSAFGYLGQAAAIAAPTAPGAAYVQAEAASMKTAVDAIRAALTAAGISA